MHKNIFEKLKNVLSDKRLTAFDKNVFSCLLTYNGKGRIFPSRKDIMSRLNSRNLPTISKSVNKLQDIGYIKIVRRKQNSNVYLLQNIETEMKTKKSKSELPKKKSDPEADPILFMNKAMIQVTVEQVAEVSGRSKADSSDHIFVNKLLKIKESDKFKDDCMNTVRKCLMLLYLIKIHSNKFKEGLPYAYFNTVYSTSSYSDINKKIFHSRFTKSVTFKTGLANSYN